MVRQLHSNLAVSVDQTVYSRLVAVYVVRHLNRSMSLYTVVTGRMPWQAIS